MYTDLEGERYPDDIEAQQLYPVQDLAKILAQCGGSLVQAIHLANSMRISTQQGGLSPSWLCGSCHRENIGYGRQTVL